MHEVGAGLVIEDVVIDDPRPNEVAIDVVASGLCHSDLKFIEGAFPIEMPALLGHEAAGIVTAVGDEVSGLAPGDHVVTTLSVSCSQCVLCIKGSSHLCVDKQATRRSDDQTPRLTVSGVPVAQGFDLGAFAPQMLVHESAVVAIDPAIQLDVAALLGCGVATGLGAVFNTARVAAGDSVAVLGCGGVGLAAIQGARIAGADPIIAIDAVPEKLVLAQRLGATDVVDVSAVDAVRAVVTRAGGVGVDHAIEAVGSVGTVEQAFAMLRPGGTATVVGLMATGSVISVPSDVLFFERKLQASVMGSNDFAVDTPRYVQMYLDGELLLDEMVSGRISLVDINHGFDEMRSGVATRNVILFESK